MGARELAQDEFRKAEDPAALSLAALFERAAALQAAAQLPQAIALYRGWLALPARADSHLAWFNLGSLLQAGGDVTGAIDCYESALRVSPGFAQALINLGLALESAGQTPRALAAWSDVVAQRLITEQTPASLVVMALNHIGRVQENLKQYRLAESALAQSLQIDPKQPGVIQHWVHVRQKGCMWPVYRPLPGISMNEMLMATSPLAMLALTDDPAQQLLIAHSFVNRTYPLAEERLCEGKRHAHQRLRIGYVSGDLCVHAVGLLLAEFLEAHDRERFEIYGYDFSPEDGTTHRARVLSAFDHVRPIHRLSDRDAAQSIVDDEIDVLIDLHGLSSGARPGIFALHPAPLQGTWLGFIGTSAMPWLDFVITDRQALPEPTLPYFRERPLYIDGSFLPLSAGAGDITPVSRAEIGLPEQAFVMASFGNIYKINPVLFDRWLAILKRSPNTVLWLIDDNTAATENLRRYAADAGVDLSRLHFSPRTSLSGYRGYLKAADLFLDTWPYNCGSTTNDVLNAGLPILTVGGRSMVSRMGTSLLSSLNLHSLIAADLDDYENRAVAFASGDLQLPAMEPASLMHADRACRLARSIEAGLSDLFAGRT